MMIYTEFIRLRDKDTDAKLTGKTVELLPITGTYPTDAITLIANPDIAWEYKFVVGLTNGDYYVYVNGSLVLQETSVARVIRVQRGGIVTASDTDFAY